jgi:hypothetical protein
MMRPCACGGIYFDASKFTLTHALKQLLHDTQWSSSLRFAIKPFQNKEKIEALHAITLTLKKLIK